jgi:SulP family sulfate permease
MYVPKMMLGGILVYLGLAFLVEWIYEAWFKFPRIEFAIILSILAVIVLRGYLEGVVVGLVLAIILFAISYSRVPVARYAVSGAEYSSRLTRSPQALQVLNEHGSELYVLQLQGFLFFGTADKLYEQIRAHTLNPAMPLRYVVLDLSLVSGMDSTATLSIKKLLFLMREKHITPAISGLEGRMRKQWLEAGMDAESGLQLFVDRDHAVEWCEDRILAEYAPDSVVTASLYGDLTSILPNTAGVENLTRYLDKMEIAAGTYLMRQGDRPDALYFIESGQLTAQLENDEKGPVRLETVRSQSSIGEIGFYLDIPRTASVVADEPTVVYRLSRAWLQELEKTDAEAANALHRIVIHMLGQRVRHLTKVVSALER